MALRDLLWACPRCGQDRSFDENNVCLACGTAYRRGRGARIIARAPDGAETVRLAAEWVDDLPDPASLVPGDPDREVRSARVRARRVTGEEVVRDENGYLNRIETYGAPAPATLILFPDRLVLSWDHDPEQGRASSETWPLEELTAVQASSSSLQLKARGRALISLRLDDDSVYLWELLVRAALRFLYGKTGRGEILEFQPRIVTR